MEGLADVSDLELRPTAIEGCFVVGPVLRRDDRGTFTRTFDAEVFTRSGLRATIAQMSLGTTAHAGTVRGMHWQDPPHAETKLVRCTRGAIHDVVIDLRVDSPTYLERVAVELSAANLLALFIPERCAHGYQTLVDDCEVHYAMSEPYVADLQRGVRHDDPALAVRWPLPVRMLSDRDRAWPDLQVAGR